MDRVLDAHSPRTSLADHALHFGIDTQRSTTESKCWFFLGACPLSSSQHAPGAASSFNVVSIPLANHFLLHSRRDPHPSDPCESSQVAPAQACTHRASVQVGDVSTRRHANPDDDADRAGGTEGKRGY